MAHTKAALTKAGFVQVLVEPKPETREVVATWMPGSGAEDYALGANITAYKPGAAKQGSKHGDGHGHGHGHGHGSPKPAAPKPAAGSSGG